MGLLILFSPVFVVIEVVLIYCFIRFSVKASWKSYLWWEAMPLWLIFLNFGLLCVFQWPYESQLLIPINASSYSESYEGPIVLAIAHGLALLAGFILFLLRLTWLRLNNITWLSWLLCLLLGCSVLPLVFYSLAMIFCGPMAIAKENYYKRQHGTALNPPKN